MKNKPLKVQPPRKVYKPKYPSYAAPNPLLHPESRPYPFSQRFASWVTAGGLLSVMSLGAGNLSAQEQVDSLYNPFPLENAGRLPYMPSPFGTGMPDRLSHKEVLQVIQKAFADKGIELQKRVWLGENKVGVYLDGYSEDEEIGFVLFDNAKPNSPKDFQNPLAEKSDLENQLTNYKIRRDQLFRTFLMDKLRYQHDLTRNHNIKSYTQKFADELNSLVADESSRDKFNEFYLNHEISKQKENFKNSMDYIKDMLEYIDSRFTPSIEKLIMLEQTGNLYIPMAQKEAISLVSPKFEKLKKVRSNEEFIKRHLTLITFANVKHSVHSLMSKEEYDKTKLKIMQSYPLNTWIKHSEQLEAINGRYYLSLEEVRKIDRKNKNGTQFIAPISSRDNLTVISSNRFSEYPKELYEKRNKLREEYRKKNNISSEAANQKQKEYQELNDKYSYDNLLKLSPPARDSLMLKKRVEKAVIDEKYKAMERLTEEEKEIYKMKINELSEQIKEQSEKNREEAKMKTQRKLEEEVKMYIQWAKSQMGG